MESSDPKAYPGVWRGITDEKPVDMNVPCITPMPVHIPTMDRIVEGNKTMSAGEQTAFELAKRIDWMKINGEPDYKQHIRHILADRLAVVKLCREELHDRFGYVGNPGFERLVDTALDAVKEKLK
jgi:hypothetical protein